VALPPSRQSHARSWLAQFVVSCAWFVTLALVTVAALRIFCHDSSNVLICLNAFTRYIYLPAYACLAFAFWRRRWWLLAANIVIIGCHLFWIAPDFTRDARFEAVTAAIVADKYATKSLRIYFANICDDNRKFDALLNEIADTNPDVVVIAEFSWYCRQAFLRSSLIPIYPYGNGRKPWERERVTVFSRLPIPSELEEHVVDRVVVSVDISLGSHLVRLIGLHSPRPKSLTDPDYETYWERVIPLILNAPHPLIVVGDCNATQYSAVYQQLKASGLRSAHEDRGRGYATSWPNGMEPLPPIRIDQAFLSSDVACKSITEGIGAGSDHKPLILDVQIRDRR
jgi:endonuclease/exonuclease/phosphatase (EEP) superfamily protein YafD